jgi:hypothetical protein
MGFGTTPAGTDGNLLSSAYVEDDDIYVIRGQVKHTDGSSNTTVAVEVSQPTGTNLHIIIDAGTALIGGVQIIDNGGTNKATVFSSGALKVDGSASTQPAAISSVDAGLAQADQLPVSNAAPQGKLTLSLSSLTANSDNSITFSGGATVARRIRIQNESTTVIYWQTDATASAGSPSLAIPGSNAVSVEWVAIACTTLHIFIPSGGTTTLNGSGGVKVTAYA